MSTNTLVTVTALFRRKYRKATTNSNYISQLYCIIYNAVFPTLKYLLGDCN